MNRPTGCRLVVVLNWCGSPGRQKSIHSLLDHIRPTHGGQAKGSAEARRALEISPTGRTRSESTPPEISTRRRLLPSRSRVSTASARRRDRRKLDEHWRFRPPDERGTSRRLAKYPREGDFCRPAAGLGEMTAVRSGRVNAGQVLPNRCIRPSPPRRTAGIAPPAGRRCGLRAPPARSIRGAAARAGLHRIPRSRAPRGRCRP